MKLPKNSHPGVYKLNCSCKKPMLEKQDAKFQPEHNDINNRFMMETGKSLGYQNTQKLAMELLIGQKWRR